jgi:DNA recombination protein RmuC
MVAMLWLGAGLVFGAVVAWLIRSARAERAGAQAQSDLSAERATSAALREQLAQRDQHAEQTQRQLQAEQKARVEADTRLSEAQQSFEQQRTLLAEAEQRLKDTFTALSVEALKSNNEAFAKQADEKLAPLRTALERYEKQILELERARQSAYGGLAQRLTTLADNTTQLQRDTTTLAQALRSPQVRGRWGEITLKRVVELAGLTARCDFDEQVSIETEEGRRRPDMIVRLPGQCCIPVDAKVPLAAYLDSLEAADESARKVCLTRYAQTIRTHVSSLRSKAYWDQFESAPELVVMFLPGETFLAAALDVDRTLIEDGIQQRVLLTTPTTLIALLLAVAHTWQQQQMVDNAKGIGRSAQILVERICKFAEHLGRVGGGLEAATKAFNSAVASWETRVAPAGRRVFELGVPSGGAEFPSLERIDVAPRDTLLASAEADPQLAPPAEGGG